MGIPYITHAYIGRDACGCIKAACIDNPTDVAQTKSDIDEFLGCGLIVLRVPVEEGVLSEKCPHESAS